MTAHSTPYPTYYRVKDNRILGGVCAGLAAHLGVELTWVRFAFVALLVAPGLAIPLYIALVIFTSSVNSVAEGTSRVAQERIDRRAAGASRPENINRPHRSIDWAMLAVGAVMAILGPVLGSQQSVLSLLLSVAAVGVFLVWNTFGVQASSPKWPQLAALVGGVVLLIGGIGGTLLVAGTSSGGADSARGAMVGWAFVAALLAIIGFIVVLVPLWLRLWSSANQAAEERAAEAERAEIASRIHDSVLQTLTMIQKSSSEPNIVTMARSQERQLRQWLFATDESVVPETLFGAVRVACGEVEDTYGIRVRPVLVGEDMPSTDALLALALAGREAMVNAAKHSGCDEVHVFLEAEPDEPRVEMYVRDRGPGFDAEQIPEDRQGVRQSILGRMERAGGTVEIDTSAAGTEVIMSVPRP